MNVLTSQYWKLWKFTFLHVKPFNKDSGFISHLHISFIFPTLILVFFCSFSLYFCSLSISLYTSFLVLGVLLIFLSSYFAIYRCFVDSSVLLLDFISSFFTVILCTYIFVTFWSLAVQLCNLSFVRYLSLLFCFVNIHLFMIVYRRFRSILQSSLCFLPILWNHFLKKVSTFAA